MIQRLVESGGSAEHHLLVASTFRQGLRCSHCVIVSWSRVVVHLIHDTLELVSHAVLGRFGTNHPHFGVVAARLRAIVVLLLDIAFGDAHLVLLVVFLRRIMRGRRSMFHPMIDLRSFGVAHRLTRTFHLLPLPPGIVDGSGTGVILTGHLVYGCIATDLLFLGDCAREKAGEVR